MTETQNFSAIWNDAVDKYKSETKAKSLPLSTLDSADSAEAILTALTRNRKDLEDSRAKGRSLRDVLKPIVKIVKLMAEIAGEGASLAFAPGKTIFVAIGVLLEASDGVSKSYDSMIDIFESLSNFLGRLNVYLEHNILPLMKEVIVKILAHLLSILGVATRLTREKRAVTYFKTLIGENSLVQDALTKLDKLTAQEGQAVAAATLSVSSNILSQLETRMKADQQGMDVLSTTKSMLTKIAQEAEAISGSSQESQIILEEIRGYVVQNSEKILPFLSDQHRREFHQWLGSPSPLSNYETGRKMRRAGTGSWFIQATQYKHWKTKSNSVLWVTGGPGCGKSVLSSTIIQDIEFNSAVDSSVALAYFYFDFRDSGKQSCLGLVSSLVDQLASRCLDMPAVLDRLYATHRNGILRPTLESLVTALKEMIVDVFCSVYIVIDALDECSERETVMDLLEEITKWKLGGLHILLTSRKEEDLNVRLLPLSVEFSLQTSLVDRDIVYHVRAALQHDQSLSKWKPEQKQDIETCLIQGAHGMFRWVFCQLDIIRTCPGPKALRKHLVSLPKTLYETYDRIFQLINPDHSEYVHATLKWLAFSMRPVKLEEVAEVLAIDFDNEPPRFVPEDRFPEPREILTMCSSLVRLSETGLLELSHFSVKEYLTTDIERRHTQNYLFDSQLAHDFIARTCVTYLMQFTDESPDDIGPFPLACYAAEHWMSHVGLAHTDALADLALNLLQSPMAFVNSIRIYDDDRDIYQTELSRSPHDIPPPLFYAARAGFVRASKLLIENGAYVNARGGTYNNALQAASSRGHEAVVILLLEKGADVNAQGGEYGNALQAASFRGHETIVRLLLEKGANANAKGGSHDTALQAASFGGHETIVRLLLETGADVHVQGGFYGNALQVASSGGHEAIVRLLLEQNVDVNAKGGHYGNALQAAACNGHEATMRSLLENGAYVNAQGGLYGNALQAAICGGHKAIVQLLLEKEADVNAQGGEYGNALQAASSRGHEVIVRLLLERDADVNAQGGQYGNALQAASSGGYEAITCLLLEKGADVNAKGGHYGNALQAASSNGYKAIVQRLLEKGADVNAQGGFYGNALQAASSGGYEAIVRLLFERGANVNAQGGLYNSALQAALSDEHEAIVQLLLEKGAISPSSSEEGPLSTIEKAIQVEF